MAQSSETYSHSHRIFEIEDLVLEILGCLERVDQVRFGQCSRFLWHFAAPSIWRYVPSITALAGLLPRDTIEAYTKRRIPPNTPVLPNLEYYAPNIRELYLSDHPNDHYTDDNYLSELLHDTMPVLAAYQRSKLIFIRLDSLHLILGSDRSLNSIMCLLETELKTIKIHIKQWSGVGLSTLQELFELLARKTRKLEDVTFLLPKRIANLDSWPGALFNPLFHMLSQLRSVNRVHLRAHQDTKALLRVLATLPLLESLHMETPEIMIVPDFQSGSSLSLPSNSFPALKVLIIDGLWPASYHLSLMEQITSTSLSTFSMLCEYLPMVHDVLDILVSKWPATLRDVSYRHAHFPRSVGGGLGQAIRPLLRCSGLQHISIELNGHGYIHLAISDEEYRAMATAWPALRSLKILDDWPGMWLLLNHLVDRPKATRQSLLSFAEKCPELEDLAISLDLDLPAEPGSAYPTADAMSRLATLNCCYSAASRPKEAAAFIQTVFPDVTLFTSYNDQMRDSTNVPLDGMEEIEMLLNGHDTKPDDDIWGAGEDVGAETSHLR